MLVNVVSTSLLSCYLILGGLAIPFPPMFLSRWEGIGVTGRCLGILGKLGFHLYFSFSSVETMVPGESSLQGTVLTWKRRRSKVVRLRLFLELRLISIWVGVFTKVLFSVDSYLLSFWYGVVKSGTTSSGILLPLLLYLYHFEFRRWCPFLHSLVTEFRYFTFWIYRV